MKVHTININFKISVLQNIRPQGHSFSITKIINFFFVLFYFSLFKFLNYLPFVEFKVLFIPLCNEELDKLKKILKQYSFRMLWTNTYHLRYQIKFGSSLSS